MQKAVQRQRMGILLCEQHFWDVWSRNESVRAEVGQILHTDTRGKISSKVVCVEHLNNLTLSLVADPAASVSSPLQLPALRLAVVQWRPTGVECPGWESSGVCQATDTWVVSTTTCHLPRWQQGLATAGWVTPRHSDALIIVSSCLVSVGFSYADRIPNFAIGISYINLLWMGGLPRPVWMIWFQSRMFVTAGRVLFWNWEQTGG